MACFLKRLESVILRPVGSGWWWLIWILISRSYSIGLRNWPFMYVCSYSVRKYNNNKKKKNCIWSRKMFYSNFQLFLDSWIDSKDGEKWVGSKSNGPRSKKWPFGFTLYASFIYLLHASFLVGLGRRIPRGSCFLFIEINNILSAALCVVHYTLKKKFSIVALMWSWVPIEIINDPKDFQLSLENN